MRWGRPQNVITSVAGEKRPPRGPVRRKQLRRHFLIWMHTVFSSAALHCGIHRPAAIAGAISDTALDAAITGILFEPGVNTLEEFGRIIARHIGATERFKRAVHGAILVNVFALAPLLFTVVGPPLRRV